MEEKAIKIVSIIYLPSLGHLILLNDLNNEKNLDGQKLFMFFSKAIMEFNQIVIYQLILNLMQMINFDGSAINV